MGGEVLPAHSTKKADSAGYPRKTGGGVNRMEESV